MTSHGRAGLHPVAWLAWVSAVCMLLSLTRNPFYLCLVILCIGLTASVYPIPVSAIRLSGVLWVSTALVNLLVSRTGSNTLFSLPASWPLLGGNFTLEALVYGTLTGMALAGIVAAFRIVQGAVPTRVLLDLLPAGLTPLAVTLTIAVAFFPASLRQLQAIREAQAVRGHRMRGLRDWAALLVPLLIGSLDRAMALAEALASRGFPANPQRSTRIAELSAAGLGLVLVGMLWYAWNADRLAVLVVLFGITLLLGSIWSAGRRVERIRYRGYVWQRIDLLVVAGAVIAVVAVPGSSLIPGHGSLVYSPYPALTMPMFEPATGLAILGLVLPGLIGMLIAGDRQHAA